ncbi:sensor histidine kinase [Anaerosacchariphilus polymeriproducens]|uniref:histidine kinase n=1 Tax=Anaerosacchariphilus polymeriproducens TaxID=1812858 RepID=A0A371AZX8_9FIRM|nr:HAMP domain-containing sensor histidine kinase [Anaerosacchariphilus polymeriproducens]RDU25052.1 sensor histidine kinase [Anaerosacchariphilus polymeriproducens]
MENKRYAGGWKIIVLILQQIFIITFIISGCVVSLAFQQNYFSQDIYETEFVNTQFFRDELNNTMGDLFNYLQGRSNFETAGVYDGKKTINIKDYYEDNSKLTRKNTGSLNYYLADLLEWAKKGIKEEAQAMDPSENLYSIIEEEFLPEDGMSLKERYLDVEDYTGYLEAVGYLEGTLDRILKDVTSYKKSAGEFQEGSTNLSYILVNEETGMQYDNMDSTLKTLNIDMVNNKNVDSVKDKMKKLGVFLFYDAHTLVFDSNIDKTSSSFYDYIERYSFLEGSNYKILIGIDKNFPIKDNFVTVKSGYEKLQPWFMLGVILGIASVVGCFLCFVYLTCAAGRVSRDLDIHLNWFDHIKTEIAGLIITIPLLILSGIIFSLTELEYRFEYLITFGVLIYIFHCLFMCGYLSLVRRFKAKTVWKNSIFYMICYNIVLVFRNRKVTTKVFFTYGLICFIALILAGIGFGNGDGTYIFLLLIELITVGIFLLRETVQRKKIMEGVGQISNGDLNYKLLEDEFRGDNKELARAINNIGDGLKNAVDASVKNERLKTDLITNVSHDIKTPLTSIINYVDLLKRENITDEKILNYISILDSKSQRLKHLTEDLVEASKISSGNITLVMERINFKELIIQTSGEFSQKFDSRQLILVQSLPDKSVIINADGRRIWRVIENLYNNVAKYAMENTRVYADLEVIKGKQARFSIKNISEQPLNIQAEELTERFIRGDVSRSTEGSGLGLSIAKNLTELQQGIFEIYLDGDLFKVTIAFPVVE